MGSDGVRDDGLLAARRGPPWDRRVTPPRGASATRRRLALGDRSGAAAAPFLDLLDNGSPRPVQRQQPDEHLTECKKACFGVGEVRWIVSDEDDVACQVWQAVTWLKMV